MFKICIDAGHGGYDSGAVGRGLGPNGTDLLEKNLTLAVAKKLQSILIADGRFKTVMTRDGDYAPGNYEGNKSAELTERSRISNVFGSHLFISIHFNAFNTAAHGVEALDYNGTGVARVVAQTLCDIIEAEEGLLNRGVKATNSTFAVIRQTKCPALISESAFIDNAQDIKRFDEDHELAKLAWYHYRAICAGLGIEPQPERNPNYVKPKTWDEVAFDYLVENFGIDRAQWKPSDPVTIAFLGELLRRKGIK